MLKRFLKVDGKKQTWYITERASFKTLKDATEFYDKKIIEKPKAKISIAIKRDAVWVDVMERRRGAH